MSNYAFLQRFWAKGYAYESASAVMNYGRNVLKIPRIVAITAPDNEVSIHVLDKIGLQFEKLVTLPGIEGESKLFVPKASNLNAGSQRGKGTKGKK